MNLKMARNNYSGKCVSNVDDLFSVVSQFKALIAKVKLQKTSTPFPEIIFIPSEEKKNFLPFS